MASRKKCEQYAAAHNLTIDFAYWREFGGRCYRYSVDLPDGMITADGYCGKAGDESDSDLTAPQVWDYILADMESLVEQEWLTIGDYEAAQTSA